MKTIIKSIGLSVALFAMASAGFAQTNLPFLTSKSALRSYAVEQATTLEVQVWCSSQTAFPTYPTMGLGSNHTSADIIRFFTNTTVGVTIANPLDYVYSWGLVMNADGWQLFYGYAYNQPVNGKGGYYLPPSSLVLKLNSVIPVKFDRPVASAEMWHQDPNSGQTDWKRQLSAYGNTVYFQTDDAGSGYLSVTMTDGTGRIYNLKDKGQQTGGMVLTEKTTSANIENLSSYVNPTQVTDVIQSYGGVGENKTYEVLAGFGTVCPPGYTCVPFAPLFKVTTSEGAIPLGYWYRIAGSVDWQYVKAVNGSANIPFTSVGTWYVIPNWNPVEFHEQDPSPPYYGEGKG